MRAEPFQGLIFVIDTDTYAGNFEREMCAFVTGQVGECGKGVEYAKMFTEEHPGNPFDNIVVSVPDEHGCWRPASIYPTPGFWNDGMGNEWPDEDWGKQHTLDAYQKSLDEYEKENPGSFEDLAPEEYRPRKHPSYQSVAIFLDKRPDPELLDLMVQRALVFSDVFETQQEWNSGFQILAIRLVTERVQTKVVDTLWSV